MRQTPADNRTAETCSEYGVVHGRRRPGPARQESSGNRDRGGQEGLRPPLLFGPSSPGCRNLVCDSDDPCQSIMNSPGEWVARRDGSLTALASFALARSGSAGVDKLVRPEPTLSLPVPAT